MNDKMKFKKSHISRDLLGVSDNSHLVLYVNNRGDRTGRAQCRFDSVSRSTATDRVNVGQAWRDALTNAAGMSVEDAYQLGLMLVEAATRNPCGGWSPIHGWSKAEQERYGVDKEGNCSESRAPCAMKE